MRALSLLTCSLLCAVACGTDNHAGISKNGDASTGGSSGAAGNPASGGSAQGGGAGGIGAGGAGGAVGTGGTASSGGASNLDASVEAGPSKHCPGGEHGEVVWAQKAASTGPFLDLKTATDRDGNIFVAGAFEGTLDLNDADASKGDLVGAGNFDAFVAKYDDQGTLLWAKRYGDANNQYVYGLALDSAGDVYLGGFFYGRMNLAGTDNAAPEALVSAGQADIFIAKLDGDGHHLWSHSFGDAAGGQYIDDLALDRDGNVVVTGTLQKTMTFRHAGDAGMDTLTSAGQSDVYVAKFDADGHYQWSGSYGDLHYQGGDAIATDAAGNVYVAGFFENSINFSVKASENLTNSGANHYGSFVVKLDPDGKYVWSHGFGDGMGFQGGNAIAVSPAGAVYLQSFGAGDRNYAGTGPSGIDNLIGQGQTDVFVAKFDTGGKYQWSHRYGDAAPQYSGEVAIDADENVYLVGPFQGSMSFAGAVDGGPGTLTSQGGTDVYVAKLAADGSYVWSESAGDGANQSLYSLAMNGCSPIVAGYFTGSLTFPRASDGGNSTVSGGGGTNLFLARFAP